MAQEIFDEHLWRYEALVDWDKRLANEAPFYRNLFAEAKVHSVLDTACGTGHHAEMLHSWGLRVEGADLSEGMIARCRTRLGEPDGLRWAVRPFDRPSEPPGAFDAVLCVGNSLSLAPDMDTARRAVRAMLDSARPGGICVIHVLNVRALPEGAMVWQKTRRLRHEDRDHILLKGIHREGARAWIEVVDLALETESVKRWSESTSLLGIEADDLISAAKTAGASHVETFGDYRRAPYDPAISPDLIAVFRK